jgi:signal transduction histidine kinase/CheY-like chemotaxis protein
LISDLVLLLLGFLFSTYFGRSVVRQIDKVSMAVNRIARGDLTARCALAGGDDFMRLAQGVNQMAFSIDHTQTELKHARDKALQASRVKSEFLANMSHEIRTPLNVVIGYTDLLAAQIGAQGNEGMRENLDSIRRAGRRLIRTIQGILDFSKIEARSFELRPETLEVGATLERHVQDMRILAERKNIQLACLIDEPRATIQFDEYCLSGALTNLLQNAIKFTKEGSITVTLYRASDRLLKVAVKDTGVGIDLSYLTRIFEPFSQEESGYSRSFEGNGLGLALTRRYLELNGAAIEVQSRKGQGSVFTITFSAASELRPTIKPPSQSAPSNGVVRHTNGRRAAILVVEDDEDNQSLIRKTLENQFEVRIASSADEARRELEEHSVDLILMDWSLHGAEDGVTLTRSLRQDDRFKKIPVVAVTAHALPEDRKLSVATGFDAFLGKPIDRDELFRTLDLLIH